MRELQMTDDLNRKLAGATSSDEIASIMREAALAQGFAARTSEGHVVESPASDATASAAATETQQRDAQGRFTQQQQQRTAEPQTVTKTEVICGRELTFTGADEHEVNEMILNAYKVAQAVSPQNMAAAQDNSPEMQALRRSELDLQFRRGQISPQEYLEKSGAIADYLETHGAPLEVLQQTVEQVQAANVTQSWADAVTTFLNSPAGRDWPGGDNNRDLLGLQLQNLNLTDADDKVAALAQAYQSLKERNMLFKPSQDILAESERDTLEEAIAKATTPEELRVAMEAYNNNIAAKGQDPNEFFVKTHVRSGRDATYRPATPSGERQPGGSGVFNR